MEHMQGKGDGTAKSVMYIRGVPFICAPTAGKPTRDASPAASVAPAAPPASAGAATSRTSLRINAGFCDDNLLPGLANPASGRCSWTGVASRAQAELMKSRRSVRVFAEKIVSMRVLRDLVAAACRPAPGEAPGRARFVMLESAAAMDKAADLAAGWLRREGILVDGLGPEAKAREVVFGGAPHMAVAYGPAADAASAAACSLAVARMEWIAAGLGLGVCFAGEMVRAAAGCEELAAAMAIPASATVYAALFLGYPGSREAHVGAAPGTRIVWL